jgi:hypothetical protein
MTRRKRIPYFGILYYHAGTDFGDWVRWADSVTTNFRAAMREAHRLAREHGGRPVIEWWPWSRGDSPGPDGVEGTMYVGRERRPE